MNELTLDNRVMPIVVEAGNFSGTYTKVNRYISSEFNSLYIFNEASFQITENDITYNISAGSAIFIKQGTSISLNISNDSSDYINMYYYYFNMPVHQKNNSANQYIIPKILKNVSGSILFEKAERYVEYYNSDNLLPRLDTNSKFYDILSECVKYNIDYRHSPNNLSENIILFLNEHINEPLNTKDMEKRFFLTYKYMGTIFKKETGYTILNYHTLLRLESAKKLLVSTYYSIDEISRQLGYSDPLYFSRVFKKHVNISPLSYRKKHTSHTEP